MGTSFFRETDEAIVSSSFCSLPCSSHALDHDRKFHLQMIVLSVGIQDISMACPRRHFDLKGGGGRKNGKGTSIAAMNDLIDFVLAQLSFS